MSVHFNVCLLAFATMILSLEGYCLSATNYIVKELTTIYDDGYEHFLFDAPEGVYPTEQEWRTINFAAKYVNQLKYTDKSLLPYSMVHEIFKRLANYNGIIYVAGNVTYDFVKSQIPLGNVIDVFKLYDFQYPKVLPSSDCFKMHNPRYCSKSKARYLKISLEKMLFKI